MLLFIANFCVLFVYIGLATMYYNGVLNNVCNLVIANYLLIIMKMSFWCKPIKLSSIVHTVAGP